ncbi:MAG: hypothetical protein U0325_22165 [Polyangiales bacterium]
MADAPEPIPSRPRVALRATAFFALSFVMSANGNVLPQQFFQRHAPTQKAIWLASCLLLGTVTATFAVWRARRGRSTRGPMLGMLAATLLAEAALFTLHDPVAYLVLNAVAVFGANTLTNHVDLTASARAGTARRGLHDAVSNLARLVGILTAPWFFTRHLAPAPSVFAALAGAGALGALAVGVTFSSRPHGDARAPEGEGTSRVALTTRDRLLAGYALALYVSLYLLAANILYLLRDVVRLPDAEPRGGVTISLVFLSALSTNALAAWLRVRRGRVELSPASLAAPAFVLVGAAGALRAGVVHAPGPVLAGSVVLGLSYGFFLAEVREWCSRGAREEGKTALLTLFNNMTNLSSLVAFGTMLSLALAARQLGRPVFGPLLGIIGFLPAVALSALWAATRRR